MKQSILRAAKTVAIVSTTTALTVGLSVFATTIGTNISADGTLTVSGDSTFGNAATDVNLFTGTLQASTTALFTNGLTTYGNSTFGDAAADVNLFTGTLQASTTVLFTGALTTYGNVTLGDNTSDTLTVNASTTLTNTRFGSSGATITGHLSASSTVDFDSTTAGACNTKTVTVTGATERDTVLLGLGDDLGGIASSTYNTWVSAADTVSVQLCLFLGAATTNPSPAALRVDVWKH